MDYIFENAGPSLRSYMYEATVADGFVVFQHSAFWRKLRMGISRSRSHKAMDDNSQNKEDDTDGNGGHLLKEVLKQIVRSGNVSILSCACSFTNNLTILIPVSSSYVAHIRRLFT